jgi:hypothetical protein
LFATLLVKPLLLLLTFLSPALISLLTLALLLLTLLFRALTLLTLAFLILTVLILSFLRLSLLFLALLFPTLPLLILTLLILTILILPSLLRALLRLLFTSSLRWLSDLTILSPILSLFALSLVFLGALFSTTATTLGARDAGNSHERGGQNRGGRELSIKTSPHLNSLSFSVPGRHG